jgi:CubicO group peptidase (beta-lactamase class C family)
MRPSRATAVAAAAVSALLVLGSAPAVPASPPRDRVDGWATASPAALGLRPARLKALAAEARTADSTCYAVVRDGRLARDWNWGQARTTPREVFSITKSVTSALVGIAVRDGSLRLDDRVSRYVPQWRGTASEGVSVRNLLSNDSGRFWSMDSDYGALVQARNRTRYAVDLPQQYPPGSTWAYNNAAIQVLEAVLRHATGTPVDRFASRRLFAPLGMTHTRMGRDASGRSTSVFFGLQTTCLDLARFGRLYLGRGAVDGQRILSRGYVSASVGRSSTPHNAAYGLLWWLNRPGPLRGATDPVDAQGQPLTPVTGQLAPQAPRSTYAALGLGGQVLLVDPRSRTLVVRLGRPDLSDRAAYGFADAAAVVTTALR